MAVFGSAQQVFINAQWVVGFIGGNCLGPLSDPNHLGQYWCNGPPGAKSPLNGNISNNPHIEFDDSIPAACLTSPNIPFGSNDANLCNQTIFLCTNIGYSNTQSGNAPFALDSINFEVFQFGSGSNPLDPQSTPPLKTFFIDSPGLIPGNSNGSSPSAAECTNTVPPLATGCGFCVPWDGSINILGFPGKTNGTFGFRSTVATNQTGANGNINITQTRAYPSGPTLQLDENPPVTDSGGATVLQQPIFVDVTNVHVIRTTPTVVGSITGVASEPYNITYRLSKDASMYITIENTANTNLAQTVVRQLVSGLPRVGEGTPGGSLQNGDAWNGRGDNGDLMPPGIYRANLSAYSVDDFGEDQSTSFGAQISLDPLQITDILVQPLTNQSTSLAVLTYTLTEPATVYIDIYPPGTQFCRGLTQVNASGIAPGAPIDQLPPLPPKGFGASLDGCTTTITPLRSITEQKLFRTPVISFWDGRDNSGAIMPDGDYVFVIYAALPSQNGFGFFGSTLNQVCVPGIPCRDMRIWTSVAKSGYLTVSRGMVTISQITPSTTVIGSTPSVAGLNPFIFTYTLSRDANVNVKILDSTGQNLVKTLVQNEIRPGNFLNREIWPDGVNDAGLIVSSGAYLVQLTASDVFFPAKVTTTTALFPVDMFRITDVAVTPLLTGATDVVTLNYQLSQGMNAAWNIYPPGTVITNSATAWPPCGLLVPGICANTLVGGAPAQPLITVNGMRPGRLRISEFWDGRNTNGLFVPDGTYIFTLVAQSTTTPSFFASDRIMGQITVARGSIVFPVFNIKPTIPTLFNSSQTITLPPFELDYSLTRQSSVTIRIFDTKAPPSLIRTVISGQVRDGQIINQDFWDGRDDRGNFVPQGFYTVQAVATDLASILSSGSTVQQTIAVDPLRVYDVAVAPLVSDGGSAQISYQVSETMKVGIKIFRPKTQFDTAGNPTPPEAVSLVRRIVGVRAARSQVNEIWDGRDERLTMLPDGNYVFRIVASTDITAIDSITGNLVPGAALAQDLITAEVPVIRTLSTNPEADFNANTFIYPNPVSGSQATFNIFLPFQSNVQVKIFNIAGELVWERQFSNQAPTIANPSGPLMFTWPRTNNAGRQVASGVYFVLIREEETLGGANVLQAIKKVLVQ